MATTTKPKRKYTRRKIMASSDTATQQQPVPTESSFMEGLRKNLTERDQQIKDRINALDAEMAKLTEERSALVEEQDKLQAGMKALDTERS
jgi:uncharacterized protein (DUF3084 family)